MLLIIAPSKRQDFDTPAPNRNHTMPALLEQAGQLAALLREMDSDGIGRLMGVSTAIADQTLKRFKAFAPPFTPDNAKPAIHAFQGTVFQAAQVDAMDAAGLQYLQTHLRILSGLYGCLRPLDLIQPYRLEMQTKLAGAHGSDLYGFWGDRITEELNRAAAELHQPVLVNLASNEYFKSVNRAALRMPVLRITFKECGDRGPRVVATYSKRARGLMVRFAVTNGLEGPEGLKEFRDEGYRYSATLSTTQEWIFTRRGR